MSKLRNRLTYANVMATTAVFIALGGAAYAANTIGSDDIINGQVKTADISNSNGVRSADVRDDTQPGGGLSGADLIESSLGEVPSAQLGGFGRWTGGGFCDPESTTYVVCTVVTRTLPAQSRLLLIAQGSGVTESGVAHGFGQGSCRIGTTSGPLLDTETFISVENGSSVAGVDNFSLVGITAPLPAGQHSFGLDCRELSSGSGITINGTGIATVAISPD